MRRDVTVEEWIAALESGKFRKVRTVLRERLADGGYGYCCLGVLCEIAGTTWGSDGVNKDVGSAATILRPSVFGPQIARYLRDTGMLASLNDNRAEGDDYTAAVKQLLAWQEEVV